MYSKFRLVKKYIHYFFSASNGKGHGVHSPFVFNFITRVLNDRTRYPAYEIAENLRSAMKRDTRRVQVKDFGAGSAIDKNSSRNISSVANHAAKSKKIAQLLFRIVRYYQPATIIELGTSLGISGTYLALGNPGATLISLEGADEIAAIAEQNFKKLRLENISVIKGNFDDTLQLALAKSGSPSLVFIDGNHRKEPTIRYFKQVLEAANNDTMLIFDDIHWSEEMEDAWNIIQADPAVRCTMDLFFIGIVILKSEFKEKINYTIRF